MHLYIFIKLTCDSLEQYLRYRIEFKSQFFSIFLLKKHFTYSSLIQSNLECKKNKTKRHCCILAYTLN